MSKRIPFNIKYRPQIESGEYKVITNDGHNVRIICWDKRTSGEECIVALVSGEEGGEKTLHYTKEGYCTSSTDEFRKRDLFIVIPEKELTEFEGRLVKFYNDRDSITCDKDGVFNRHDVYELLHSAASELLSLARKEFAKEYKGGSEANEKTISAYCSGYEAGKADAFNDIDGTMKVHCKSYDTGYDNGMKDALKDLPRWKKIGQGNNYSSETKFCINGRYLEMNDTLNYLYEISLKDLDKLPKEDEE